MNQTKIFIGCLLIFSGIQILSGQNTNQNIPGMTDKRLTTEQNQQRDLERRRDQMRKLAINSDRITARNASAPAPLTKEEREKIKKLSQPLPEDLKKYESFLNQPETGITRLYPDFDCEDRRTIRVSGECLNFVSGMWAYSFIRDERADKTTQDISIKKDLWFPTVFSLREF